MFDALLRPDDEIALVSFDDVVETPAPMAPVSDGALAGVLAGTALDPRNLTSIGGGILAGAGQLALATHANRAMLVLTDGLETAPPYVASLPAGTLTDRTYAIGLGLPADVSVPVLHQITANTHGELIVTGDVAPAARAFALTKYFVQVLAGVTRMDVVLDPQGSLFFGSKHVIPFQLTDADIDADVIALCPVPELLDFALVAPNGELVSAGPNVELVAGPGVRCYRVTLPADAAEPDGTRGGGWRAVLALKSKGEVEKLLRDKELSSRVRAALSGNAVPYSLVVHAYSNLKLAARLQQRAFVPGSTIDLDVALSLYGASFAGEARVWAEVAGPSGASKLALAPRGNGAFAASFVASAPGVYACRIRAEGRAGRGVFTRERTLTAAIFLGEQGPRGSRCSCEPDAKPHREPVVKRKTTRLPKLAIGTERAPRRTPPPPATAPELRDAKTMESTMQAMRDMTLPPAGAGPDAPPFPRRVHMFTRPEELAAARAALAKKPKR